MNNIKSIVLSVFFIAMGSLYAEEIAESATKSVDCVSCLTQEEQLFAETLSPRQQKLFLMMSKEQREIAMDAAEDIASSSDHAVEQVIKEDHLSILNQDQEVAR